MEFNGKIDQLAFISFGDEDTRKIKETLGLQNADWTEDVVVASGEVRGVSGTNTARLLFNYDMGIEVEILQYLEGPNYASNLHGQRICHYGIHATAGKPVPTFDAPVIQRVKTRTHTNEFLLKTGRTYQYTIYDTMHTLGVYTKVIERIEAGA